MKKMTELKDRLKRFTKIFLHHSFIVLGLCMSFTVGFYFNHIKELNSKKVPEAIKRGKVTIAVDEFSNIMIVNKSDGSYTILQDSVGKAIFNTYAKSLYQNQNVIANVRP